jgi:hypothetical protein
MPGPAPPLLLQTVPLSQATEAAKPLPKQTIDKGKVWQYFIGGAVTLFLGTIALENYEGWFPAISRANKAMAASRQSAQQVRGGGPAGGVAAAAPSRDRGSWVCSIRPASDQTGNTRCRCNGMPVSSNPSSCAVAVWCVPWGCRCC